jgi:hypothetical protein
MSDRQKPIAHKVTAQHSSNVQVQTTASCTTPMLAGQVVAIAADVVLLLDLKGLFGVCQVFAIEWLDASASICH